MAHNIKVRGGGWINGSFIPPGDWASLDLNTTQALNGVDGGAWAPTNTITIDNLSGGGFTISGPTVLRQGARFLPLADGIIKLLDNDYPIFPPTHAGRKRTIVYPCMLGKGYPRVGWRARFSDGGMQAMSGTIDLSDGSGPRPLRLWVPIRAVDGSTMTSVTVNYRVGFPHTDLPPTMPTARVVRMSNATGEMLDVLTSVAAGASGPDGYVPGTPPASAGLWSGPQSLTLTCDQNNAIDVSQYDYFVEIVEETGLTGYPWSLLVKPTVTAAADTNITSIGTIDGVTSPATFLEKLQTHPQLNGVYDINGSPAEGFTKTADMPQGVIIPIDQGNANGGSYWQLSSNIASWQGIPTSAPNVSTWRALTNYSFLTNILPTPANANGYLFFGVGSSTTTLGGTSGSTEPTWPLTVGASVHDGTMLWTNIGPLARQPIYFVARSQQDDETPDTAGFGLFAHGNIYQSVTAQYVGILDGHFQ